MDHPSPEDYDDQGVSDADSVGGEADVKHESSAPVSPSAGADGFDSKKTSSARSAAHLKRRRVTRACDECRRKKIKCDGKQPCTHCTVYSYECTYDQPSNRRRNPAPQYVENLEHRVHRAEALLHILIPNLDLSDPGIDAAVSQGWIPGAPGKGNPVQAQEQVRQPPPQAQQTNVGAENKSDKLESMVKAVAEIEMDEAGNWSYHGHSSGLSFVRRMREQLGDWMAPPTMSTPFLKSRPMSTVLESPKSIVESPQYSELSPGASDLPPKHLARKICRFAIEDAAALLRPIHGPTFWEHFDQLYSLTPEQYSTEEHKFLPLFHSTMALGHLFHRDESSVADQDGYENAIQLGFVHFKLSRSLIDITDCRDLMSIQTVIMMILFLQSSAKLSQCYAYVGVALRSALRMGLHRNYKGNFNPIEIEMRKRVFWGVRKLDIYVGAMIGLPLALSEDDIDQEFPAEIDEEYVTKEGILPMPEGQVSLMTAFNSHTRLVMILAKIVRCIYPIKVQEKELGSADKSYSVPFATIREIENELEQWKNALPAILNPSPAPERYTRVQHLLRMAYAHTQVMLYRPFLHYVARQGPVDQRAYACAASYVGVSRNVIHITTQMKQKGLLNGAFWFSLYTCFFAVLSLLYYAAENPDNPTTEVIMKDVIEGREVLASLAKRSMAADRCTATLDPVFTRLPEWLRNGQQNPVTSKKRPHEPTHRSTADYQTPSAARSHPDVSSMDRSETVSGLQRRAGTFPRIGGSKAGMAMPTPHDTWSQSGASSLGPQTPTSTGFSATGYINYNPLNMGNGLDQVLPPQYSMQQGNYPVPAITDLSTMVFPAPDEPFGYPHQPLTTFENNEQFIKPDPYGGDNAQSYNGIESSQSTMMPGLSQSGRDDNIEAQFFALPPYIGQQQFGTYRPEDPQALGNGRPPGAPVSNGWMGAQSGMPLPVGGDASNINIQDIFGGTEWNSLLMNGFQPQ